MHFGYAGLFVVMFLGNMGAPAGTEIVMPSAGALGAQGHLPGIAGPAGLGAGRAGRHGRPRSAARPRSTRSATTAACRSSSATATTSASSTQRSIEVHGFYERFGTITVFWCRFVPFVRGVASFPAGLSRMQKRYFITYTALGSAIFCFGLAYLGNVAGNNIDAILAVLHKLTLVIVGWSWSR